MVTEEELDDLEVITLENDEGEEKDFVILLMLEEAGKEYAVLSPVEEVEADDDEPLSLMVFSYTDEGDGTVSLNPVEDEDLATRIFEQAEEIIFSTEDDEN